MRYTILFILFTCLGCHAPQAQNKAMPSSTDEKAVMAVLTEFLAAGDVQDTSRLAATLHPTFRILINQFMGGPDVTVFDRDTYLGLVGAKKFGGDPRTSDLQSVEVVGNLAFVRSMVKSSTLQFDTQYTLVQDQAGKWWLAGEHPFVTSL